MATEEQVAAVKVLLPEDAPDNGWDDDFISERWSGTTFGTVRLYWLDRVNATSGYIDLSQEGLPATQLWQHARDMLAYWESIINGSLRIVGNQAFSRKIKRV